MAISKAWPQSVKRSSLASQWQRNMLFLASWQAGWTCLFYATYHNEANIVQYLLMHGADPDQKDNRGMTAVDWGEHMEFGETCAIFSSFESQLAS